MSTIIKAQPGDSEAIAHLVSTYDWTRERAVRVLAITNAFGTKAEATAGGYVLLTRAEGSYVITDHTGREPHRSTGFDIPDGNNPVTGIAYND